MLCEDTRAHTSRGQRSDKANPKTAFAGRYASTSIIQPIFGEIKKVVIKNKPLTSTSDSGAVARHGGKCPTLIAVGPPERHTGIDSKSTNGPSLKKKSSKYDQKAGKVPRCGQISVSHRKKVCDRKTDGDADCYPSSRWFPSDAFAGKCRADFHLFRCTTDQEAKKAIHPMLAHPCCFGSRSFSADHGTKEWHNIEREGPCRDTAHSSLRNTTFPTTTASHLFQQRCLLPL